ncbi:hypothetical protein [Rufibacter psychrotolerans]|uniref:hypothetical protein n=1 Tax=Rufibacter psychrotolerans TaxID=2812556 RepID=UPI001967C602|nr:hypothetical protein [Rufibacter sp. SYSU D00308]
MHIDLQVKLVYQDDYLKVEVDENVKFIYLEWFSPPATPQFREAFQAAARLALDLKIEYWLSDARVIPYLDFAEQNWVLREMTPLLMASPLRKYARLSTKESIGLLDFHRIYSALSSSPDLEARTQFEAFTDKDSALEWLFADYKEEQAP